MADRTERAKLPSLGMHLHVLAAHRAGKSAGQESARHALPKGAESTAGLCRGHGFGFAPADIFRIETNAAQGARRARTRRNGSFGMEWFGRGFKRPASLRAALAI